MYEKVNASHPDKICDRIGGAIVDLVYRRNDNPKIAVECLLGHGKCHIIIETNEWLNPVDISEAVHRIAGDVEVDCVIVPQDERLADNQSKEIKCGDNGIFKGTPITDEQELLTSIAKLIYNQYPYDGKYILDKGKLVICQSNAKTEEIEKIYTTALVNPIGEWTGGPDVDTGAINRKLGSDMGDGVTGGGLHGKDLSKADVSVNIYAFLKAQVTGKPVEISCAIGDTEVDGQPYARIVEIARKYIKAVGGFEKFAEWGLIR